MKTLRKIVAILLTVAAVLCLSACGKQEEHTESKTYKIGICNYVDDASLNQIVDNIQSRLAEAEETLGVHFKVDYDNCNGDAAVMQQIISNFQANGVDLMIGIATPVAMQMQAATDGTDLPVVFAAVSDPVGVELVESLEKPGANITGTSDYLDAEAVMDLVFAADPEASKIGLLYDVGQDSSKAPIEAVKKYLNEKGVSYVERTGTTTEEVKLAAQALITDGVDAVFTPTDNTIMTAELSIYEDFIKAGIPHYTGADSFALNGAFLGYGVDYANLGRATADLVVDILVNGANPKETSVVTFDNGLATVNTETCEAIGFDPDAIREAFAPHCTELKEIITADSFEDLD